MNAPRLKANTASQRGVLVYAHQQIADRLKRRTIGSSRCRELPAECQQRQQAHDADHVEGRLQGPEDDGSEGETRIPLLQDRIHRDGNAATGEVRDEREQRSCGHLVRMCGEPSEVVRTSQNGCERRTQERPATVAMMKITPVMTAIFRVEFILYLLPSLSERREGLQPSLSPMNAYLCSAQKLVRRCFCSPGSDCRRIEPFDDQPDRQNHLLHGHRNIQKDGG